MKSALARHFRWSMFLSLTELPLCRLAPTTLCAGHDYATDLISLTTGLKPTTLGIMHSSRPVRDEALERPVSNS